jgi:hypothetical protein
VATKSVGEKASPLPLLSMGASVIIVVPDAKCSHEVLKSPRYVTLDVAIVFLFEK